MPLNMLHCSVMALSAVCAALHAPVRPALRAASPTPAKRAIKRISQNTVEVQGVRVRATAYVDRNHDGPEASRYDLEITHKPSDGTQWYLDYPLWELNLDFPPRPQEGIIGETSAVPYQGLQTDAPIICKLRQVDTREERVTFYNLDVARDDGLGFVCIAKAQTVTTPDGVTVTLPAQNMRTFMPGGGFSYNGPPDVVFARVQLARGKRVVLPASPLYQRHKVPVSLQVRVAPPSFTNTFPCDTPIQDIHFTPVDKHATHLDSLTLIIRQVAELQTIPLKFEVPIDRSRHE